MIIKDVSIIDTAFNFREVLDRPIKKVPSLQGVTIVNLFFENSLKRMAKRMGQKCNFRLK